MRYKPDKILEPIRDAIQDVICDWRRGPALQSWGALTESLLKGRKERPDIVTFELLSEAEAQSTTLRQSGGASPPQPDGALESLRPIQGRLRIITLDSMAHTPPGRPEDSDTDADILAKWESGDWKTRASLARSLRKDRSTISKAIKRAQDRREETRRK